MKVERKIRFTVPKKDKDYSLSCGCSHVFGAHTYNPVNRTHFTYYFLSEWLGYMEFWGMPFIDMFIDHDFHEWLHAFIDDEFGLDFTHEEQFVFDSCTAMADSLGHMRMKNFNYRPYTEEERRISRGGGLSDGLVRECLTLRRN